MVDVPRNTTSVNTSGLWQILAYASPLVGTKFLLLPVQLLLAGIYAKYFGLALTTIASIVLLARIFDAVTDPLIGYFSDRYREKKGTRKPWILFGNIALVVSSYFLFVPPDNVSVPYFLGWYFAFYLAFTMVDIPHYAWGGEIATGSQDKNRVYSIRLGASLVGWLLFNTLPLLPFFEGEGFTPETMKWSVLVSIVLLIPALTINSLFASNGRQSIKVKQDSVRKVLRDIYQNKPLLNILAGIFLMNTALGVTIGLLFIFVDGYLRIGSQFPLTTIVAEVMAVLMCVAVYRLSASVEKVTLYTASVILGMIAMGGLFFLDPDQEIFVLFTILMGLIFVADAMQQISAASLISDAADYGIWKFRADRTATYFAIYAFSFKSAVALGGAIGLALVGWSGFDVSAAVNSEQSALVLRLVISGLPVLLLGASLFFVLRTPLTVHRNRIIRRRIESRAQREGDVSMQTLPGIEYER